jgi:hypothetical protein
MRLRRAVVLVSCVAASAAACTSFSSEDPPAGPDGGGEPNDVNAPAPDATAADADAAASSRLFCDGHRDASFCWSFDEGADPLQGPKLKPFVVGTSSVAPTLSDAAFSAPFAMQADVPNMNDTSALALNGDAGTHFRCDFRIFVSRRGAAATNVIFLRPVAAVPTYALVFEPQAGSTNVTAKIGIDGDQADIGNVPLNVWTPVSILVSIGGSTSIVLGNVPGAASTKTRVVDGGFPPLGGFELDVGLTFTTPPWTVRYDDVVCNWN